MGNVVTLRQGGGLSRSDRTKLQLFRKTVGKNLQGAEFDEAVEWCEIYGANPFTKDIYFFIFDADDPSKRRVVPVLGIGLYRKIAARTGNYRPDEHPARFRYDEQAVGPDNPRGIIDCEVSVYQFSHGQWFAVTERLRWDERAPIIEASTDGHKWEKTGEFYPDGHAKAGKPKYRKVMLGEVAATLDPHKKNWRTMPETMLAKCVEAAALRKAFPNELSGSYADGELDHAATIELTATEIVDEAEAEARQSRLGGPSIPVDPCNGEPLEAVPIGKFHDWVSAFVRANAEESPEKITLWINRNREPMRQFWAHDAGAALDLKKTLEVYERAE